MRSRKTSAAQAPVTVNEDPEEGYCEPNRLHQSIVPCPSLTNLGESCLFSDERAEEDKDEEDTEEDRMGSYKLLHENFSSPPGSKATKFSR